MYLSADAQELREGLSLSSLLQYEADIDGTSASSPFKDNQDSYSNRDELRLHRLALDYEAGSFGATLGRWDVWSAERFKMDGALVSAECPSGNYSLEAFGGAQGEFLL